MRWIRVDDGVVVFVPEPAQLMDLNESAGELWSVLEHGEWNPGTAVEHLVGTYGMALGEAEQIVGAFLADLESRSVISRAS